MPQMGYDMQEGTVVRWLKAEGSAVDLGEPIAEIETDKAVVEFESYAAGVLHRILVSEGTTVPVGQPIAMIGEEGEAVAEATTPAPDAAPEAPVPKPPQPTRATPLPAATTPVEDAPAAATGEIRASPVARKLADERGIDLATIKGTGPGGRITKDDVLEAAPASALPSEPAPAAAPTPMPAPAASVGEPVPLSRMRQQIARVTARSKQEKPHFYVTSDIDMTRAMELRREVNRALESEGVRVTVNDLIIRACVEALKRYPKFNAYFENDGIRMNEKVNVGIAVAEEEGLIVPAIMDCADRSLKEIATASKDLAERAEKGTLHPQEYAGGTFAISNLGMFEVTSFVAIIYPPQTAVLAVGKVADRPVARDGQVTVAQMMTATLSADHRIVDGAEGARFIVAVKELLENPLLLVL